MRAKIRTTLIIAIATLAIASCTTNRSLSEQNESCYRTSIKELIDTSRAMANQGKIEENKNFLFSAVNKIDFAIKCATIRKFKKPLTYLYLIRGNIHLDIAKLSNPNPKRVFLRRANADLSKVIKELKNSDSFEMRGLAYEARSYAQIELLEIDGIDEAEGHYGYSLSDIISSIELIYDAKPVNHEKLTEIYTNKAIGAGRASAKITGSKSVDWAKNGVLYATVAMNHAQENGLSLGQAFAQEVRAELRRRVFDAQGIEGGIEPLREAVLDHQLAFEKLSPEIGKHWAISVRSFAYTLFKLAVYGPSSERLDHIARAEEILDTLLEKTGNGRIEKIRERANLFKENLKTLKYLHICTKESIQSSIVTMSLELDNYEKYLVKYINKELSSDMTAVHYGIRVHKYTDFPGELRRYFEKYKNYETKLRLIKLKVDTNSCRKLMLELPELIQADGGSFKQEP